jgi:hypothetical protein
MPLADGPGDDPQKAGGEVTGEDVLYFSHESVLRLFHPAGRNHRLHGFSYPLGALRAKTTTRQELCQRRTWNRGGDRLHPVSATLHPVTPGMNIALENTQMSD